MAFIFGGALKSKDSIRDYTREINKHIRGLQREQFQHTNKEKSIQKEIRKYAEKNDLTMAKLKVKELIRTRAFAKRVTVVQHGLSCLSQELTMMSSTQQSQGIIEKTNKILQALNNKLDLNATYKMMMSFENNNTIFQEKQDMISESLDQLFETDDNEVDQEMKMVCEEMGLRLAEAFPSTYVPVKTMYNDDDFAERLQKLKAVQKS